VDTGGRAESRADVIARLAKLICDLELDHPTRVAVDGITASGKSTLAGEITTAVTALGRPATHLTMDGYHQPREHRYRQGRRSARGYYEDAYDFGAFVRNVLVPLGPGGNRCYRRAILDLKTDEPLMEDLVEVANDEIVVVDGTFLLGPELADHWDVSIFVDTSFAKALDRGLARDSTTFGGTSEAVRAYAERYHAAGHLYIRSVNPADRAMVIIDNEDLLHPQVHFAARSGAHGRRSGETTSTST
jgi:uridine kinase